MADNSVNNRKLFFVAGERSGDLHGSNMIKELLKQDPNLELQGFGGDMMEMAGMRLDRHYSTLAFMGFWEVLTKIRTITRALKECKKNILEFEPEAIVLIDYAGFNLKIAKFAKQHSIKVIYYISPKVWAWNQSRAWKIKKLVDLMLVIMPFEKSFYKKYDFDVEYVGNPVQDAIRNHEVNSSFKAIHNLPNRKIVAVLPGSRRQELDHLAPTLVQTIKQKPEFHFCVAKVSNLSARYYSSFALLKNCSIIEDETYDLLANSDLAIVASGTATLETALWNVPQVVVYRSSWLSYQIAKAVIKVPYISLVNLIAGKEIVKELIQGDAKPTSILGEIEKLGEVKPEEFYQPLFEALGKEGASKKAARAILT